MHRTSPIGTLQERQVALLPQISFYMSLLQAAAAAAKYVDGNFPQAILQGNNLIALALR